MADERSVRPRALVIDVHTHVFNARYLPLENIFLSHLGELSWFKKKLAALAAFIIEEATGSSYHTRLARAVEVEPDDEIWLRVETELEDRTRGFMVAASDRPKADYAADRLATDPMFSALVEAERLLEVSLDHPDLPSAEDPANRLAAAGVETDSHSARRLIARRLTAPLAAAEPVVGDLFGRFKRVVKWLLKKLFALVEGAVAWWDSLRDFLTFVQRLMMAEREIFAELVASYESNDVRFAHLMMDMEYAYEPRREPRYPFAEQVDRMRRLADESGDRLWGFTAFHPRRPGGFSMPDGFVGVKFYPALGYRPWDNPDLQIQTAVETFYGYCVDNRVPVFAHCTPLGFQAQAGFGVNAHPKYWARALSSYPGLRLCLGHAGGGAMSNGDLHSPGWFAASDAEWRDPDNFARIVVELCGGYEHVFCEVGHLDEVLQDGHARAAFEPNFVREWQAANIAFPFATKCMFGSDHHMVRMISHAADLLDYFRGLFSRRHLDGFDEFCAGNAVRYLRVNTT